MRTNNKLALGYAGLISLMLTGFVLAQNSAPADDPQILIDKGMQAFQSHNYEKASVLFRQARKVDNQSHKLSASDRSNLDRMLDESARGASAYRTAEESLAQGKRSMQAADYATARKNFLRVVDAGAYVPKSWVQEAKVQLGVIAEKEKTGRKAEALPAEAPPTTQPAARVVKPIAVKPTTINRPARKAAARQMAKTNEDETVSVRPRASVAGKTCPVVAKPARSSGGPAVGLVDAPTRVVEAPAGSSDVAPNQSTLLEEILSQRRIQKEQALASYRDAERRIRQAVAEHQYLAARDLLRQARADLLRSRRLFSQTEMERLLLDIDSLARFIDNEEQAFQQTQVVAQMKEAEQRKLDREQAIQQEKLDKINALFADAVQLRHQKKYEEAIQKVQQVLVIEPNLDRAKWFIEDTQDIAEFARQEVTRRERHSEGQKSLDDAEETLVPWAEDVRYPKDWQEMTERRDTILRRTGRLAPGENPAIVTERLLSRVVFADTNVFKGSIRDAFNLFKVRGFKVIVRWDVLETEGVTPDDQVKMQSMEGLKDISAKKALEVLLGTMGTAEAGINYAVDMDGAIIVSTKDNLRDKGGYTARLGVLETRVYDISDLMFTTRRRMPELQVEAPTAGGGGGGGGNLMGGQQQDQEQENQAGTEGQMSPREREVVDLILQTIRPESWSPNIEGATSVGQGEGTLRSWKGHWLIIYQTPQIHSEIDQFLAKLRESKTVQISLETRFVSVSSNFLEKIGLDLDMVLNSGRAGYDFTGAQETFGSQALTGIGPGIVQPRQFSYLGTLPNSPSTGMQVGTAGGTGGGTTGNVPAGYAQPYGNIGLVPVGTSGNNWTPIPIVQGSNNLVTPQTTGVPGNLAGSMTNPAFQVMGAFLDDLQVNFLLEATQMDRYSNIVQAPRVVMQNGTEGVIQVGTYQAEVPAIKQVIGSGAGGAEEGNQQGVFFGTTLRVTATSVDLRYVDLFVSPRISSPDPALDAVYSLPTVAGSTGSSTSTGGTSLTTGGIGFVTVTRHGRRVQAIMTQVSVPDGGTVLIGGLKQSGEVEIEAGPPILNKIPGIKRLFNNKATTKDNFTLLILVKPKIILREEVEPGTLEQLTRTTER